MIKHGNTQHIDNLIELFSKQEIEEIMPDPDLEEQDRVMKEFYQVELEQERKNEAA
jgi:hypothetical protein